MRKAKPLTKLRTINSGPTNTQFKPVSSSLSAEEYRMLRVFAALEDKNLGQIIRVAVQDFLNQRKIIMKS